MKLIRKSWFGNLNFWILQWFFIRLAKVQVKILGDENYKTSEYKTTGWQFIGFIVPCTGWSSDYIYIKKMNWKIFKEIKCQ